MANRFGDNEAPSAPASRNRFGDQEAATQAEPPESPELAGGRYAAQAVGGILGGISGIPGLGGLSWPGLGGGAVKGATSTALHTADLAARAAGRTIGYRPPSLLDQPGMREAITPTTTGEKIGFGGEQMGEFFMPIPGLNKLQFARNAPTLLRMGAGALREGLDIGLKTAAQTGDLEEAKRGAATGAIFGAAGPLLDWPVSKVGQAFRRSAEKEYAQVLAPGTKADKYVTAKKLLTPAGQDLLDRRVMGLTESGLKANIARNLAAQEVELENAWRALGPTHQHSLQPVLDALQHDALEAATEEIGPGQFPTPGLGNRRIVDPELYGAYQDAGRDLIERLGPRADQASAFSMRKVRQLLDEAVKKSFRGGELTSVQQKAKRAATDAMRDVLNHENPTIGAINKEYSFWRNAEDVFENTSLRRVGQRRALRFLARTGIGIVTGAVQKERGRSWEEAAFEGVVGGYLGGKMEDILTSTAWKTVSAVNKANIARMLANGQGEAAVNLAARLVGRARVGAGAAASKPGPAAGGGAAPSGPSAPGAAAQPALAIKPGQVVQQTPPSWTLTGPGAGPAAATTPPPRPPDDRPSAFEPVHRVGAAPQRPSTLVPVSPAVPKPPPEPQRLEGAGVPRTSPIVQRPTPQTPAPQRTAQPVTPRGGANRYEAWDRTKEWMSDFHKFGSLYGVPPAIIRAVMRNESHGNPNVPEGSVGEIGIMQMRPQTAKSLGRMEKRTINLHDPHDAIRAATFQLSLLWKKYHGDRRKVLAAYNEGEKEFDKRLKRWGDKVLEHIPESTKKYVHSALYVMGGGD